MKLDLAWETLVDVARTMGDAARTSRKPTSVRDAFEALIAGLSTNEQDWLRSNFRIHAALGPMTPISDRLHKARHSYACAVRKISPRGDLPAEHPLALGGAR